MPSIKNAAKAVAQALGLSTAAERVQEATSELQRIEGELAASKARLATLNEQLATDEAIDNVDVTRRLEEQIAAEQSALGILERARTREEDRRTRAATALKREELAELTKTAAAKRDVVVAASDAEARAEESLRLARVARRQAIWDAQQAFAAVRSSAAELGEAAPESVRLDAEAVSDIRVLTTRYDLTEASGLDAYIANHGGRSRIAESTARAGFKMEREHALLKALCNAHGFTDPWVAQERWSNSDRLALIRKDPAAFLQRCIDLSEEDRVNQERSKQAYEKKCREQAEADYAERYGEQKAAAGWGDD